MHSTKIEKVQIFLPGQRLANQCFTMHNETQNIRRGRKKNRMWEGEGGGVEGGVAAWFQLNWTRATVICNSSVLLSGESSDQVTESLATTTKKNKQNLLKALSCSGCKEGKKAPGMHIHKAISEDWEGAGPGTGHDGRCGAERDDWSVTCVCRIVGLNRMLELRRGEQHPWVMLCALVSAVSGSTDCWARWGKAVWRDCGDDLGDRKKLCDPFSLQSQPRPSASVHLYISIYIYSSLLICV